MDHETKTELYLLASVTTDKTAKEEDVYSLCPQHCTVKGKNELEPAVAYMTTGQLLMGAAS